MARRSSLAVAAGCIVLLTAPARPAIGGDRATDHLDRAVRLLLAPAPTDQDRKAGFLSLLDALVATAPDAPSAAACQPKLAKARQMASQGPALYDSVAELLGECYSDAHGGARFRVPDSVRSPADAVGYGRTQLQSARASLETHRGDDAFGRMIEVAVLVVTPFERDGGSTEAWVRQIGRQVATAVRAIFLEGSGWLSAVRPSSSG